MSSPSRSNKRGMNFLVEQLGKRTEAERRVKKFIEEMEKKFPGDKVSQKEAAEGLEDALREHLQGHADKIDRAADSLRRVADGVDGLEKRLRKDGGGGGNHPKLVIVDKNFKLVSTAESAQEAMSIVNFFDRQQERLKTGNEANSISYEEAVRRGVIKK